jgi:hypothetical protein
MTARTVFAVALLGLLGIIAAALIGLLANAISGDSIGLSAQPLRAGGRLAPEEAREDRSPERERHDDHGGRAGHDDDAATTTTTTTDDDTVTEPGDDHGGLDD